MKSTNTINRKHVTLILLLGILVREVFSFWTGHPFDFELWVRLGYSVIHGSNPYGVMQSAPGLSFANVYSSIEEPVVAYLPFWPLTVGLIYATYSIIGSGDRFVYYFLLKQPIIAGDIGLAYLLYLYISSRNPAASIWALRFWALSPFTIIISAIWGMFDSIAMSFILISIMTVNYLKRSLWTSMGVFAKSIPLIYAVPLTLRDVRDWRWLALSIALPAVFAMVAFVGMGWSIPTITATLASTIRKGGESMSFWDLFFYLNQLGLLPALAPSQYTILGLVWIPVLIIFTIIAFERFRFGMDYGLVQSLLIVTLVFLICKARITEQYTIYLLALSVIDVALWNPQRKRLLLATVTTALFYLVLHNYFLIRFLSPIYPGYAQIESRLSQIIAPVRLALDFGLGAVFTYLNVRYLTRILGRGVLHHKPVA